MSDRVNNELLSAYLDDEVTAEERASVEQALADSAEARTSLESLRQVRDRLRSMPRSAPSADLHQRIVREVERRAAERHGAEPHDGKYQVAASTITAASAATGRFDTGRWMRFTGAAAALVAVLLVAVLIATSDRDPAPEIAAGQTSTGLDVAERDPSLPDDDVLVVSDPQPFPSYVMILDLAITKKGQEDDVFGRGLRDAGIAFDPRDDGVVLDRELRSKLLESRLAAGIAGPSTANERFDVVDMVYIHANGAQIDDVFQRLRQDPEVHTLLNAAVLPESVQVLRSISERTRLLAKSEPGGALRSYAYRMNVGFTLHSTRSGFFAKFPTPGVKMRLTENDGSRGSLTEFSFPIPLDLPGKRTEQGPPQGGPAGTALDPISDIVVIRRNLVAGFPGNVQKPLESRSPRDTNRDEATE